MYVAAIFDNREAHRPRLLLIRDPLGGRGAIYYALKNNTLAFSSTLRSLRRWSALRLEPNLAAVRLYLTYAFMPGEETLLEDCLELLPGHTLSAWQDSEGQLKIEKAAYWTLQESE